MYLEILQGSWKKHGLDGYEEKDYQFMVRCCRKWKAGEALGLSLDAYMENEAEKSCVALGLLKNA